MKIQTTMTDLFSSVDSMDVYLEEDMLQQWIDNSNPYDLYGGKRASFEKRISNSRYSLCYNSIPFYTRLLHPKFDCGHYGCTIDGSAYEKTESGILRIDYICPKIGYGIIAFLLLYTRIDSDNELVNDKGMLLSDQDIVNLYERYYNMQLTIHQAKHENKYRKYSNFPDKIAKLNDSFINERIAIEYNSPHKSITESKTNIEQSSQRERLEEVRAHIQALNDIAYGYIDWLKYLSPKNQHTKHTPNCNLKLGMLHNFLAQEELLPGITKEIFTDMVYHADFSSMWNVRRSHSRTLYTIKKLSEFFDNDWLTDAAKSIEVSVSHIKKGGNPTKNFREKIHEIRIS